MILRGYVTTILLFWVNVSPKLVVSGFIYAQNEHVLDKLRGEYLLKCIWHFLLR